MKVILTTVGASLITNAMQALNKRKEELTDSILQDYISNTPPERASAETNSLCRLLDDECKLIFLYSHTPEGQLCADVHSRYYKKQGYVTECREIPDLTYTESRFKMWGLRSLVATLVELIRKERSKGNEVQINATGGFKAEIAYATLVGLLFNVRVYYMHELFRDIIELPPVPVTWDYSMLVEYEDFFAWLHEEVPEQHEVKKRMPAIPAFIGFFLCEEDGLCYLSPAGEAFYEAYRERLFQASAVPLHFSGIARRKYNAMEESERREFRQLLTRLCVPEIRWAKSGQVSNSDCMVYPRGNRRERIFYYVKDDKIYVCDLACHGKDYERLLGKGVWQRKYNDFASVTPGELA
jgi:putative CRISPR-associated protein (TIGR02619 family)